MIRSAWKGTLMFGVLPIPIRLQVAAKSTRPSMRRCHVETGEPVRQRNIFESTGEESTPDNTAKRVERRAFRGDTEFAIITDEELASLPVVKSRVARIRQFIYELPIMELDQGYYVLPDGDTAEDAYVHLREILRESPALVSITLTTQSRKAVLHAVGDQIVLHTLHWSIKDAPEAPDRDLDAEQLDLMSALADMMTADVEIPDEYGDQLNALTRAKLDGLPAPNFAAAEEPSEYGSVIEALKASLA